MSKKVYIGLDVGSKTCHLVAVDEGGAMLTQSKFLTSEANLIAAVSRLPGEVYLHLEASELAGWVRGVLQAQEGVAHVAVSHPKANAWIAKDPLKGDRVDAGKLAELLRMGRVHQVYYPDDDHRREFKQLVRHYDDVTAQQVRLKQKIKASLRAQGIIVRGKGLYSPQGLQAALERVRSPGVRKIIEQLYRLLCETLRAQQQAKRLMAQAARRFPEIARFRQVPGVGLIGACRFSAYVQNPHRFSSKRKLWRYCRLGITDRSSDSQPLGYRRLDRSGNGRLKDMSRKAFEAAMKTKEDHAFKRCFRRSLQRTQTTDMRG
ncbi:MAG: transposase [Candidatus Bipolaricaulia bacterium]